MYYRLVLCGLLSVLLIAGYSQRLLAAELTYDNTDNISSEVEAEEVIKEDDDEEVDDQNIEESDLDDDESADDDEEIDEESDSTEVVVQEITVEQNLTIDYDALTEAVTEAIVSADAELTALEDESYDGSISTSYQSLFASVYLKMAGPLDDYLVYRGGQYDYYLLIGDLSVSGTTFSGDDITIVHYYARTGTGYTPTWTVSSDSVSVDASLVYSYSNLGDYAPLQDLAWLLYDQMIIFALVFVALALFIHGLIIFRKGDC